MGFFLSVLLIACSLIMRSMSMLAISTCGTDLFGLWNEANAATDGSKMIMAGWAFAVRRTLLAHEHDILLL